MSILSILVTKVRGWTPHTPSAPVPHPAQSSAHADDRAPVVPTRPPVRAFTPSFCAKLAECDPARSSGDWA